MKLSVILPVYNERNTVQKIIESVLAVPVSKEIVIVDDGSTDGTRELLKAYEGQKNIRVILHDRNHGKGRAVRTGIASATGEALIIQDADLEYDPADYPILLKVFEEKHLNVVYGSRFLNGRKVTAAWHRLVNYFLTLLTNLLYGSHLTDMETCYKLLRTDLIKTIDLKSSGFEMEAEITAKILNSGEKIVEAPISYKGRSYHEGKKIGWKDGFCAVWTLLRFRFAR